MVTVAATAALFAAALPAQGITYGHLDGDRHPSVGSMVFPDGHGGWFQQCSGALIAPKVFLTAAHCVFGDLATLPLGVTFDPVVAATYNLKSPGISTVDYLGEMPWHEYPAVKIWYQRMKSRPSFRALLGDRVPGTAPPLAYSDLDF